MDIDKIVSRCFENGVSNREVKIMIEQYTNDEIYKFWQVALNDDFEFYTKEERYDIIDRISKGKLT